MTSSEFIEILFIVMGVIMVYVNLIVLKTTFAMVLSAKKVDWMTILAGAAVHVIFFIPLAISIWGVGRFG